MYDDEDGDGDRPDGEDRPEGQEPAEAGLDELVRELTLRALLDRSPLEAEMPWEPPVL